MRASALTAWVICAVCMTACGDSGTGPDDAGLGGDAACGTRDEASCHGVCHAFFGDWLDDEGELHENEFVTCEQVCGGSDQECDLECTGAEVCAADPSGTVYWFNHGGECVPTDWPSTQGGPFPDTYMDACNAIKCVQLPDTQYCDDADAGL